MNEKYIVDRVEGEYVILEKENGDMCKKLIRDINGNFQEGDILIKEGKFLKMDEEFTKIRKDKLKHIMKNMWE